MADFGFEANFDGEIPTEEDPAAEFLAREQDVLAGLEDDNFVAQPEAELVAANGPAAAPEVPQMNGPSEPPSEFPEPAPRPIAREEPEKIKTWREEQKMMLEQKDAEEEEKKSELRAGAKKELDDWYARYNEQIEKSKQTNRNSEKEWVLDRDSKSSNGQEWETIAKLCDFNPKAARNSKDTSRMRTIILQLKQQPLSATKSA
ncbi:clathrin light chain-like [Ornithodoros turicata]|uniref:Clathrin light chain n=1 Tax=Ornithodoros turicata TaxID=34597 RepID=A0A2R5L553_9ACAR